MAVGDDTGATGLAVGAGVSSDWQANSNTPAVRASMTTVAIVRTGPVRCVELCSFKNPSGEIQIWRGRGKCIMRLLHQVFTALAEREWPRGTPLMGDGFPFSRE